MTTYPLPSLAAQITPTGIFAPSYNDILLSLTASYMSIFGSDSYLGPDSQDGQWIAIMAAAIHDSNSAAIAVYNSFSPATGVGVGLSSTVKINGLQRLIATNSTVDVVIVGQPGTTITNGVVGDTNNNRWLVVEEVVIPVEGQITTTVVAEEQGDIIAAAGTVNIILTPTRGWQTVINLIAATPGAPIESDAQLRVRQAVSTELPSLSILGGIVGAIANLPGVEAYRVYENDTKVPDADGIPGNSISAVVRGGEVTDIATVIARKKTPGTGTYGDVTDVVEDSAGVPVTIHFFRPTTVAVDLKITIQARPGYVSSTGQAIIDSILAGNNSQGIGGDIYIAKQFSYANLVGTGLENTFNVTSITMRRDSNPYEASDITIAFNELAVQDDANIELTVA